MALEMVLGKLEEKLEELLGLYSESKQRVEELKTRVAELEDGLEKTRSEQSSEIEEKQRQLLDQKESMAQRLEKSIALIDEVLLKHDEEAPE